MPILEVRGGKEYIRADPRLKAWVIRIVFFGAFRDFVIFSGGERAVDCRKSRRKRSVIVHCLSKKRVFCFCNGVVISAM